MSVSMKTVPAVLSLQHPHHPLIQRGVQQAGDSGALGGVLLGEHLSLFVDQGEHIALGVGHGELGGMAQLGDAAADLGLERVEAVTVPGGDQYGVGGLDHAGDLRRVGLVERLEYGSVGGPEVVQHLEHRGALLGVVGAGEV